VNPSVQSEGFTPEVYQFTTAADMLVRTE
jgi:hypothetical protein